MTKESGSLWRVSGLLTFLFGAISGLEAETIRIAAYNVENYTLADRMTADGYRKNYPKPEVEKTALRAAIRTMHPDVLALEEMGTKPFLDELQHDLKSEGMEMPYAFVLDGPDKDRHVAVLSKIAFKQILPHPKLTFTYFGQTERMKRGVLEIVLETTRGDLKLFLVHLKSRITERDDDPGSAERRLGEARALKNLVLTEIADPEVVNYLILGDLNDTRDSKVVKLLTRSGTDSLANILPAEDSRKETWTHHYLREDSYSRIDFILASPGLLSVATANASVFDSAETLVASDHRPVMADLKFKSATSP